MASRWFAVARTVLLLLGKEDLECFVLFLFFVFVQAQCRPWMLWHYLLTMDDSVQLRNILERDVDSLAAEYPTWPNTIQQRQRLRRAQPNKTEVVSEQVAHVDVNVVIPRHMEVAKTPRGNALKGLHARCLQQRWSPLYFATATYVARWLAGCAWARFNKRVSNAELPM